MFSSSHTDLLMSEQTRKRKRSDSNSQSPNDQQNKRRKLNKKKTPKNIVKYWINQQLLGKQVLIRHGSSYQIANFRKVSKTHALVVAADSKVELSIKWNCVYPIIDHKYEYVLLIKQNGDDNVHRYVTNGGKYQYFDTVSQKLDSN
eukprot:484732_1